MLVSGLAQGLVRHARQLSCAITHSVGRTRQEGFYIFFDAPPTLAGASIVKFNSQQCLLLSLYNH